MRSLGRGASWWTGGSRRSCARHLDQGISEKASLAVTFGKPEEPSLHSSVGGDFEDRSMTKGDEFRYGAVRNAVHLCVDMQRMFAGGTDWTMPWLPRILPNIVAITSAHPERTIFTRFIPAQSSGQGVGMWRRYYERWSSMTIDNLGPEMVDLVPELARFVPPARTFDKFVYSPWIGSALHAQLGEADVKTVIVTGGETDVCVLATVLGAVDWGFRVILVADALCSSADETHDSMMNIYMNRFGQQVECVATETLLNNWPANGQARLVS
ncbi:cysteine hydrolase family protein [Bradyrhizobium japonicum]|uniref:cysteine hydrolase family protein n=2 Tax=Nitrobacteraceae TaxID=41294 RepID=UPI0034E53925